MVKLNSPRKKAGNQKQTPVSKVVSLFSWTVIHPFFFFFSFGQIAHSCVVKLQAELQLYYSHTMSVKVTSVWFLFADSLAGTGKSDCSFWYLLALTTSSFPVQLWSLSPPIHANLQTLSTSKNDASQRNSSAPKYSLPRVPREPGARLQTFLSSVQLSLWNSLLVGGVIVCYQWEMWATLCTQRPWECLNTAQPSQLWHHTVTSGSVDWLMIYYMRPCELIWPSKIPPVPFLWICVHVWVLFVISVSTQRGGEVQSSSQMDENQGVRQDTD